MVFGERNLAGMVSSNAKTVSLNPGQNSAFYKTYSPYDTVIGYGTFYMTTYLANNAGCGCNGPLTWSAHLSYNNPA